MLILSISICRAIPRAALALLFGCGIVSSVSGSTVRVDSESSLVAAIAAAQAGDEIVLRDGEWRDLSLRFVANGTELAPIVLRAETPGSVALTGNSRLSMAGDWLEVRGLVFAHGACERGDVVEFRVSSTEFARHCKLIDCAIIDYNSRNNRPNKWVSVYGQDNVVADCHFTGKTNQGTLLTVWLDEANAPNRTIIRGNYFGPRASSRGKNEYETIRIGTSQVSHLESEAVVEGNYFEACDGEIEVISSKSCGNTYRNNVFDRCEGQLTLRHGDRCLIEGNAFYGEGLDKTSGVRVIGAGHIVKNNYFEGLRGDELRAAVSLMSGEVTPKPSGYFPVRQATISGNVFVDCEVPFGIGAGSSKKPTVLPPTDSHVLDNLVIGASGAVLKYYRDAPGLRFEANEVIGLPVPDADGFKLLSDVDGTLRAAAIRSKPLAQAYGPEWMR